MIIGAALLINWNSSRMRMMSTGLGGSKTQDNIAKGGYARFASGGSVTTATAQQGANQCVSIHQSDTPTAQCQTFCNDKFKKFHCVWCKCRACSFCPKGGEAIDEAAKEAPPPSSPPPPASPPAATSLDGGVDSDVLASVILEGAAANSSSSSDMATNNAAATPATTNGTDAAIPAESTPSDVVPVPPANDSAIVLSSVASNATVPEALPSVVSPPTKNVTSPATAAVVTAVSTDKAPKKPESGTATESDVFEEPQQLEKSEEVDELASEKDEKEEDDQLDKVEAQAEEPVQM